MCANKMREDTAKARVQKTRNPTRSEKKNPQEKAEKPSHRESRKETEPSPQQVWIRQYVKANHSLRKRERRPEHGTEPRIMTCSQSGKNKTGGK